VHYDFTAGLPPEFSFTRASSGTRFGVSGALETVLADQPRIDYDPNTSLSRGMLAETSGINSLIHSRDLTQVNWTGSADVVRDEVGIDGVANTACTAEDAGGAGESVLQNVTIANDSAVHVVSAYFKKTVGAVTFPAIRTDLRDGASKIDLLIVDTNAGTVVFDALRNQTGAGQGIEDVGAWWRVWYNITNNNSGNTTLRLQILPSASGDGVTYGGSHRGVCIVDGCQVELNQSVPSSVIATSTVAVSRAQDAPVHLLSIGNRDVLITYDDGSTETLHNEAIVSGWWPTLSRPRVQAMDLLAVGSLP
jgi:hypothetical protein